MQFQLFADPLATGRSQFERLAISEFEIANCENRIAFIEIEGATLSKRIENIAVFNITRILQL